MKRGAPRRTSAAGTVTIDDAAGLWDGTSVPTAGASRADNGELWDIHDFDLTPTFGAPGVHDLRLRAA